jgi:hypothetical protein
MPFVYLGQIISKGAECALREPHILHPYNNVVLQCGQIHKVMEPFKTFIDDLKS